VRKKFGSKWFPGKVIEFYPADQEINHDLYRVKYPSDGQVDDFTFTELESFLVPLGSNGNSSSTTKSSTNGSGNSGKGNGRGRGRGRGSCSGSGTSNGSGNSNGAGSSDESGVLESAIVTAGEKAKQKFSSFFEGARTDHEVGAGPPPRDPGERKRSSPRKDSAAKISDAGAIIVESSDDVASDDSDVQEVFGIFKKVQRKK
jgi:hypothetical protein